MDFFGTSAAERLIGSVYGDSLYSNGGRDTLESGAGNDRLFGGNDADLAFAGGGDDEVYGNEGADSLAGGAGADKLYGAGGADLIYGDEPGETAGVRVQAQAKAAPAAAAGLRTLEFFIAGEPGAKVVVSETAAGALSFKVTVTDVRDNAGDNADIADLRGLFFHVSDATLLDGLVITGADVTQARAEANGVTSLSRNVNMEGREHQPFDVGVEFGTEGAGKDDIRETTFVLHHATKSLTLEAVAGQWFGARMTSVSDNGAGRELSLKLVGQAGSAAPAAPETPPGGGAEETPTPPPAALDPIAGSDDLIEAGAGNDTIDGGAGDDEMQGEGGDDLITGGADNGLVSAASGGLLVTIGDNLYGNDGRDTFLFSRGDGVDLFWDFQPGQDVIRVSGYSLANARFGFVEAVGNRIATTPHAKIAILLGGDGEAIILNDYPHPDAPGAVISFADGSTLTGAELLQAARAGGVLATVAGAPAAAGHALAPTGQNLLVGDTLADTLNDTLIGTASEDYIRGGEGADLMKGGYAFDNMNGNMGADTLSGQSGDDWVLGGRDADLLFGDEGDDIVNGNMGEDTVSGGDGADFLRGGQHGDLISGDAGDDWLTGDRGDDTLSGGSGADTFFHATAGGADRILDFNFAEGDRVQLEAGRTYTVSQGAEGAVIDLGGGDQVLLVGVQASALRAGWILA